MDKIFNHHFKVASFDVDPFGEMRPSALLNHLQEAAASHSVERELSVAHLLKQGLSWVITRYEIHYFDRAKYGQALEINTWSSSRGELFVTRDFEVLNDKQQVVAKATISYALIDVKTRKIRKIDETIPAKYVLEKRVLENALVALPIIERVDREVELPVMLRDLDMNGHVNNVIYVQWALEVVPLEIWEKFRPATIEINYRAETHYGERVRSCIQIEMNANGHPVVNHQIYNLESSIEIARLRTTWRSIS